MEPIVPEFEELMLCGYCKQKFNENEQLPKLLSCKHYFCLQCMHTTLNKGQELYCIYCWKRTETGDLGPESLPTYAPVLCLIKNFSQLKLCGGGSGNSTTNTNGGLTNTTNNSSVVVNNCKTNNDNNKTTNTNQQSPQQSTTTVSVQSSNQQQQQQTTKVISENCHTHAMPLALWCHTCCLPVCRACATTSEHTNHQIKSQNEAKEQLINELQIDLQSMNKLLNQIQHLAIQQREFLLKILEACVTLKTHIEADLTNNSTHFELNETRDILSKLRLNLSIVDNLTDVHNLYTNVNYEKHNLQLKYQDMYLQCQLDDLIRNSTILFDFQLLKQALNNINSNCTNDLILPSTSTSPYPNLLNSNRILPPPQPPTQQNPILFLANYCMSQLYSRHFIAAATTTNKQTINGTLDYHNHNSVQQQQQTNVIGPPPSSQSTINYLSHIHHHHNHQQQQQHMLLSQQQQQQQQQSKQIYQQQQQENNLMMQIQHHHQHSHQHHHQTLQQQSQQQHSPQPQLIRNNPTNLCPLYYFNIEVNGIILGRIVIEVRADVAPKMAKNFDLLTTGETGIGYKGCHIFQCWEGESVITGDFELNNGRGGRSIFEDSYFLPDDTKLMAIRGTVGMRRTQKRHDNLGMVGSQFRIILQEMRGFTGIFGHVIEGLELVEKISTYGDTAGKPTKNILIAKCGKL